MTEFTAPTSIQDTTANSFAVDVLQNDLPVLLDFWGPQCAHCLALMPVVESLAERFAGRLAVYKIDSRPNWRVAVNLKVMSLPTFLVFIRGEERARLTGNITPEQLEDTITQILGDL